MGTRADFYVGRGVDAIWLGSIAWDGYPDGITDDVLKASTSVEYLARLSTFWRGRDDVTLPEMGWPWPWETSHTTDYAYAFDDGKVWVSNFGEPWADPLTEGQDVETPVFPDMSDQKNVTYGKRSGVLVITDRGLAENL
jgi:hypothetical protein